MDFKTDEIYVVLMSEDNEIIVETPLFNLEINNTKKLWSLKADSSAFKDVEIKGHFYALIVNKTVDNTTIASTSLQQPPVNALNDIEIAWNTASGIIHLTKNNK